MSDASMRDTVLTKLEAARRELLDLTTRNRLLSTPRYQPRAKTVEVVDEKATEVFRLLVNEGKTFSFVPRQADLLSQHRAREDRGDSGDTHLRAHQLDTKLQTDLDHERLAKRLFQLHYDAGSAI